MELVGALVTLILGAILVFVAAGIGTIIWAPALLGYAAWRTLGSTAGVIVTLGVAVAMGFYIAMDPPPDWLTVQVLFAPPILAWAAYRHHRRSVRLAPRPTPSERRTGVV